jgi:hypothetical protein
MCWEERRSVEKLYSFEPPLLAFTLLKTLISATFGTEAQARRCRKNLHIGTCRSAQIRDVNIISVR